MHSHLLSTPLVRLLGAWMPADPAAAPGMDFAERLSLWVGPVEAIALEAAHRALPRMNAPLPARSRAPAPRQADLAARLTEDVQRVRDTLVHAIAQDPLPPPVPGADPAKDAAWSTYLQQHLHLQRRMERMIDPLREHVRETLAGASAGLRQLAAMDAVLAQTLAVRQERLLPTLPALLQKRYDDLRAQHRAALQALGAEDHPARWRDEGAWLRRFEQDWREALRAEVELRLEPVLGLVEAMAQAPLAKVSATSTTPATSTTAPRSTARPRPTASAPTHLNPDGRDAPAAHPETP